MSHISENLGKEEDFSDHFEFYIAELRFYIQKKIGRNDFNFCLKSTANEKFTDYEISVIDLQNQFQLSENSYRLKSAMINFKTSIKRFFSKNYPDETIIHEGRRYILDENQ